MKALLSLWLTQVLYSRQLNFASFVCITSREKKMKKYSRVCPSGDCSLTRLPNVVNC